MQAVNKTTVSLYDLTKEAQLILIKELFDRGYALDCCLPERGWKITVQLSKKGHRIVGVVNEKSQEYICF